MPFFEIGMKTDNFKSCGHCWVFQICWRIECSTFTASSFRFWQSSIGIPIPQIVLFVIMLPQLCIPGCLALGKWITPRLCRPLRSFLYSSSGYPCHFLIFSASVRSIPFLSFIVPIFSWDIPLAFQCFPFYCFPLFLCSLSNCALRNAFLSLLLILFETLHSGRYIFPFLLCLFLIFFSQLFFRPPQITVEKEMATHFSILA